MNIVEFIGFIITIMAFLILSILQSVDRSRRLKALDDEEEEEELPPQRPVKAVVKKKEKEFEPIMKTGYHEKTKSKKINPFKNTTRKQAILLREILGPPKGLPRDFRE